MQTKEYIFAQDVNATKSSMKLCVAGFLLLCSALAVIAACVIFRPFDVVVITTFPMEQTGNLNKQAKPMHSSRAKRIILDAGNGDSYETGDTVDEPSEHMNAVNVSRPLSMIADTIAYLHSTTLRHTDGTTVAPVTEAGGSRCKSTSDCALGRCCSDHGYCGSGLGYCNNGYVMDDEFADDDDDEDHVVDRNEPLTREQLLDKCTLVSKKRVGSCTDDDARMGIWKVTIGCDGTRLTARCDDIQAASSEGLMELCNDRVDVFNRHEKECRKIGWITFEFGCSQAGDRTHVKCIDANITNSAP